MAHWFEQPRPASLDQRDVDVVSTVAWPLFARSVLFGWVGGALHLAWFVRRNPEASAAVRQAKALRLARNWGFFFPFGVAAVLNLTVVPASMFMQGTEMGDRIRRVRARAFGLLGYVDPWAVALHQINLDQERFKRIAAVLPPRPSVPDASALESLSADELERLRVDYATAAAVRHRVIKEVALASTTAQFAGERNRSRSLAITERKNSMILRAVSKSELPGVNDKREPPSFTDDK